LITGGTTGIGFELAKQFLRLENTVLITGRDRSRLDAAKAKLPGVHTFQSDAADSHAISSLCEKVTREYPELNVLINNAGLMRRINLQEGGSQSEDICREIETNLNGPIRMVQQFLPHLKKKEEAAIVNVSSGLAFVPMALTPSYCATKAAIHSYTQSLRYQLKGTRVEVLELIPPYVQTHLMGARQANDPNAMPLNEFIAETMKILKKLPNATEICVERVKPLRFAEANGNYDAFFKQFNDARSAVAAEH